MNVSIFGLGYVGAVTAGCLTERGHRVIGADVQQTKVDAFNAGMSPIVEPELNELLASAKAKGLLSATTDAAEAVRASDVSIVCVGTPSLASGRLNLDYVRKVSEQISAAIAAKGSRHVVIFRSTMLPGSTRAMVDDFFSPQRTQRGTERTRDLVQRAFGGVRRWAPPMTKPMGSGPMLLLLCGPLCPLCLCVESPPLTEPVLARSPSRRRRSRRCRRGAVPRTRAGVGRG